MLTEIPILLCLYNIDGKTMEGSRTRLEKVVKVHDHSHIEVMFMNHDEGPL